MRRAIASGLFAGFAMCTPQSVVAQNGALFVDAYSLVSHIFRTTPATIGGQRGPVATAS